MPPNNQTHGAVWRHTAVTCMTVYFFNKFSKVPAKCKQDLVTQPRASKCCRKVFLQQSVDRNHRVAIHQISTNWRTATWHISM